MKHLKLNTAFYLTDSFNAMHLLNQKRLDLLFTVKLITRIPHVFRIDIVLKSLWSSEHKIRKYVVESIFDLQFKSHFEL